MTSARKYTEEPLLCLIRILTEIDNGLWNANKLVRVLLGWMDEKEREELTKYMSEILRWRITND